MFKYAVLIGLMLPTYASAADYIQSERTSQKSRCAQEQWGNHYCVVVPPVEKMITDCDPGVNCHHMESGQHYSIQSPIEVN